MISMNVGEWSEVYVFLKLLGEGKLFAADKNLKPIPDIYYPILEVLKSQPSGNYRYIRNGVIRALESTNNVQIGSFAVDIFEKNAINLFEYMKLQKGNTSYPDIEKLLNQLGITEPKYPASKKEDIVVIVEDQNTNYRPQLNFSIKSRIGSASTLLNASGATNFTYSLRSPTDSICEDDIVYGDEREGVKKLLNRKIDEGYFISFSHVDNQIMKSNLRMVDITFPEIMAEMLLYYYLGKATSVVDLTKILENEDPFKFGERDKKLYSHKIKDFLFSVALGMTPSRPWTGEYFANGGYIIVLENGDVLCYHIYNLNDFKDYLFENTKLETGMRSRHNFGKIYSDEEELKIKLNLQIRFIK